MSKRREKPRIPKPVFSFRKHIVPPVAGLLIMATIFGALNIEWIMAQSRYHFIKPAVVTTPTLVSPVKPDQPAPQPDPTKPASITIPAIGVEAPIVFDEPSVTEWKVQVALRRGTLHYGQTAVPGQAGGNVVIVGHSSGLPWAPGEYKWVFTLLDKLKKGDEIHVSYQGLPYVYQVTETRVVEPEDVNVLNQTVNPMLTLITCTPVGTSKQRLVIRAKQISPSVELKKSEAKDGASSSVAKPQALPR